MYFNRAINLFIEEKYFLEKIHFGLLHWLQLVGSQDSSYTFSSANLQMSLSKEGLWYFFHQAWRRPRLFFFPFFFFWSPWRSDDSYPQAKSFNLQVKLIFTLHMLTWEWQKCLTFLKSVSGKEKDKHNIRFLTEFSVSKICFQWNVNLTKMLCILLYLGKDIEKVHIESTW